MNSWREGERDKFPAVIIGHRVWSTPAPRKSAQRSAQFLRHVEKRLIVFHQMLGAVDARHRARCDPAAQAERDEAIENRLVALAEQPFVVVGSDPEIERAIAEPGIVVDD